MKKILFYYHHFGGLGHGTRILSLCKDIKLNNPEYKLLVINSGKPQPELKINKYAKVINLPFFEAESNLFSGLKSEEDLNKTFEKRENILNNIAAKFVPDVAIFEHFPFGRDSLEKEIVYFIEKLKRNVNQCRIYSAVRDIIEQKVDVKKLEKNLKLLEGVFVFSDKEMGFLTSFEQSKSLKEKLIFCGRTISNKNEELIDKNKIKEFINCENKKLIVAGIGGGIVGHEILHRLIDIKTELDKKIDSILLITTGPSIDQKNLKELKEKIKNKKDIFIDRFNNNYLDYINAADLYISTGGYNSTNNALYTKTNTIIFPLTFNTEQTQRAKYFNKFFDVLDYKNISNKELISVIMRNLGELTNSKSGYAHYFNGGEVVSRILNYGFNFDTIKIRLLTQCNLNCKMCSWKKQLNRTMQNFSMTKDVISQAKLIGIKTINFTGGEPTMYPHFEELVRYVKDLGLNLSLSTNGIFSKKKLDLLIEHVNFIDISLDSQNPELHDFIRGRKGAFEKTLNTIKIFGEKGIKSHINITIRPDNFKSINKIIPFLANYISSISFTLVDAHANESKVNEIKEIEFAKYEHLSEIKLNEIKELIFTKKELESYYFNELPLILKQCIKYNIKFRITPFFAEINDFEPKEILRELVSNKEKYINSFVSIFDYKKGLCQVPKKQLRINMDGEFGSCCYLDDHPLGFGNTMQNKLLDILLSKEYINFVNNAQEGKGKCAIHCKRGYVIYKKYFTQITSFQEITRINIQNEKNGLIKIKNV